MTFAPSLETDLQNIKLKLSTPQDIIILSHRNPDGDAVGSTMALKLFLEKQKHFVKIIYPSEFPAAFSFIFEGNALPIIYDLEQQKALEEIKKASVIFMLDFNSLDRIDKMGETVQFSTATKILIDHHIDPEPCADYIISDTASSSTSELIYLFIKGLGNISEMDLDMGQCILMGIITDTGSFRFSTRALTYQVASELKAFGVDDYTLQNKIFNSLEPKYLKLLGHCLSNRMVVHDNNQVAFIYLTKEDYVNYSISRGDTEGIVNYLMMMKDVKIGALITEQPSIIKISLRSKENVNVQQMATAHFNGGGHKNASGGYAYAKLDDVIARFNKVVSNYLK